MFTEQLENIITVLEIKSNSEFARYADCDRSYISFLRSGKRTPSPDSRAVKNLSKGIYNCAVQKNLLVSLGKTVDCSAESDRDEVLAAVCGYLFEGIEHVPKERKKNRPKPDSFGNKLNAVMELSELSNIRLAQLTNIDASLVSRYRRGLRSPKGNQDIVNSICRAVFNRVEAQNRINNLCELIGVSEPELINEDYFKSWLCDFDDINTSAIEGLLEGIENISSEINLPLLTPEQALEGATDNSDTYIGTNGLRRSVLRFLGSALKNRAKELWLYSDQNMDWMTCDAEFSLKWISLMAACVKCGIKIKIIHNIDRGLEEMIEAIKKWLPLYMSGRIESFYSDKKNGGRFSHTVFLAPEVACVSSVYIAGRENNARYHYYDDSENLNFYKELYSELMYDCRQLVNVQLHVPSQPLSGKGVIELSETPEIPFDNIKIAITQNCVIIRRLTEPVLDFAVTHPLMRNAFLSYSKRLQ